MIFTAIFGLLTGLLPEVLKWLNKRTDNAHEIEMFKLQVQAQEQMHRDRLEEINTQADIQESVNLHEPLTSYGVQVLDKMHDSGVSQWFMMPLLYLYSLLDALQIMVRPGITIGITAFYMVIKYAQYDILSANADSNWSDTIVKLWTTDDMSVFVLVLSYWFGNRAAQAAFGRKSKGWNV